ncbi:MAG: right-handed parallel beta-helix repeat-containing protein [Janthinobacterium lividum]
MASTYYINTQGSDGAAGTSAATAWRTIDQVNATTFQAGDRILFAAGQTFSGSLVLHTAGTGVAATPIVVSSYGSGRATVASGNASGFYAQNAAGIDVRRLAFVGSGRLASNSSGMVFYLDLPDTHLTHLRLDSLDVSGYRDSGISIGSWKGSSGYSDVRITACQVHANGEAGLSSYAENLAAHHNWYVGNCKAFDNPGRADVTTIHTGSGIMLAGIDNVLIEYCEAYQNGRLNASTAGGPVGIWGYRCNALVIQHCESHHNSSGTRPDGGGFDLDGGCTNSILQYNYSHDNEGPGYELCQYQDAPAMYNLTVRYNVSINDARMYDKGAIQVWSTGASGGIQQAAIYNNTVVLGPSADGSNTKVVYICTGGFSDLTLRNNVFQSSGNLAILSTVTTTSLRLEGNCYWNNSQVQLDWNGTLYTNLAAWRAATGQEQLADGRPTGLQADPQLQANSPALEPAPGSPLLGAGLNLQAEFNINPGPQDLLGNPTPPTGTKGNIGATEAQAAATPVNAAPLPVVLTAFTVARTGGVVTLRWRTASEQGNAYFAVENSADGHTFTDLSQVLGQGTTAQAHSYTYEDRRSAPGTYYRLRQVDNTGHFTYSPVRTLASLDEADALAPGLQLYPQPATAGGLVTVGGAQYATIQLRSGQGQLLANVPVGADGTAQLPLAGLAAGLYMVQCGSQHTKLLLTE